MITTIHHTREAWLKSAVLLLSPLLKAQDEAMPAKWAVSVGFPKGGFKNIPVIGECWDPIVSADKVTNMFISPILAHPLRILDVLLHEMIHAAVGIECKHKGPFRKVARAIGLKGKITATTVEEGTELHTALLTVEKDLGPYPGTAMRPAAPKPKAPWFLVKLVSPNDPGFKFTIAPRLIEEFGMPKDHMGDDMEVAA